MKKVKRWRYYCDFCKKSGCSGFFMNRHEIHCTMNPNRICRMCAYGKLKQNTVSENIEKVKLGFDVLSKYVNGCPCCILSALRQSKSDMFSFNSRFAFKDECKNFLEKC